ncbi:hypothetical protein BV898_12200 [Hypsibius exemplaris]|uniref:Uncharacterized protein n=1 Tax=Hypsibius exemplaris TaxID=2072580 RepID=A0A1W0WEL0_HYPEX|nr:hypothetical protein BV898_12200 [Hypsibius exemplaris]
MTPPSPSDVENRIYSNILSVHNTTIEQYSGWTLTPTFFLIICILGSTINGTMLLLFLYDKRLRTPFRKGPLTSIVLIFISV